MRVSITILGVALSASVALADAVIRKNETPSTAARLFGGKPHPVAGGVFAVGGSALRYLGPKSRRWKTLHDEPGGTLSTIAVDDSRALVLATSNGESVIHYFKPRSRTHREFAVPVATTPSTAPGTSVQRLSSLIPRVVMEEVRGVQKSLISEGTGS